MCNQCYVILKLLHLEFYRNLFNKHIYFKMIKNFDDQVEFAKHSIPQNDYKHYLNPSLRKVDHVIHFCGYNFPLNAKNVRKILRVLQMF